VLDHPQSLRAVDTHLFDKITHGTELPAAVPVATPARP
jgi:hypothetical protein